MIVRIYKWQLMFLVGLAGIFGFVIGKTTSLGRVDTQTTNHVSLQKAKSGRPATIFLRKDLFSDQSHKDRENRGFIVKNGQPGKVCRLHSRPLSISGVDQNGFHLDLNSASFQVGLELSRLRSKKDPTEKEINIQWIGTKRGIDYEVCTKGSHSGVVYKTGI